MTSARQIEALAAQLVRDPRNAELYTDLRKTVEEYVPPKDAALAQVCGLLFDVDLEERVLKICVGSIDEVEIDARHCSKTKLSGWRDKYLTEAIRVKVVIVQEWQPVPEEDLPPSRRTVSILETVASSSSSPLSKMFLRCLLIAALPTPKSSAMAF